MVDPDLPAGVSALRSFHLYSGDSPRTPRSNLTEHHDHPTTTGINFGEGPNGEFLQHPTGDRTQNRQHSRARATCMRGPTA